MYNDNIMNYYKNPKNMGQIDCPDAVGKAVSPQCGDVTTIYLQVKDNIITDITFETFGCAVAVASGSVLTELVKGKSINDASQVTSKDIIEILTSVSDAKTHCADLAEQALKEALNMYKKKGNE